MTDIEIVTGSEFMVSQATSLSDRGEDFLDAWVPKDAPGDLIVVDVGRIIIPDSRLEGLRRDIQAAGLVHRETKATV